jgi:hypothetical protein
LHFIPEEKTAHVSFVHEANRWFQNAAENHFTYDSTNNWNNLNAEFLSIPGCDFLDTRPEQPAQRKAFEDYMNKGGGWMGFHFAGFALTPSEFTQNWDWYHDDFLGAGSYVSNTWRPVPAVLRVMDKNHPVTRNLPETFRSAASEWYRWSNDLRNNPGIDILLAIDSTSFHSVPVPNRTKSGIADFIPLFGRTKNTGWCILIWDIMIWIMNTRPTRNFPRLSVVRIRIN